MFQNQCDDRRRQQRGAILRLDSRRPAREVCRRSLYGRMFGRRCDESSHSVLQVGHIMYSLLLQSRIYLMSRVRRNLKIAGKVYPDPRAFPNDKGRKLIQETIQNLH